MGKLFLSIAIINKIGGVFFASFCRWVGCMHTYALGWNVFVWDFEKLKFRIASCQKMWLIFFGIFVIPSTVARAPKFQNSPM